MKTRRIILLSIFFITAGAQGMKAQDYSVTIPDGPVVSPDSLSFKPLPSFLLSTPSFRPLQQADRLFSPLGIETKEQRAARINQQTFNAAMLSVDRNLYWHRPQKIPKQWMPIIFVARLFLTNPCAFPEGYVPLMNHSFPFIYAKTPGLAPYDSPYTSEQFPKCIDTEYDFATGTYKQVMVDWSEVQSRLSNSNIGFSSQPVPYIPVTPVERAIH